MDSVAAWKAAKEAQAGATLNLEGVAVPWETVAALRGYSEPRSEGGEMVFVKGPAPRRRLVVVDGVATLEVV